MRRKTCLGWKPALRIETVRMMIIIEMMMMEKVMMMMVEKVMMMMVE